MSGLRLRVLSDLHLDLNGGRAPDAIWDDRAFDVLVIAGDIGENPVKCLTWLAMQGAWADKRIVYVPGNHEFYGQNLEKADAAARAYVRQLGDRVVYLNGDAQTIEVDGRKARFVGATLWTDLDLTPGILNVEQIIQQGMADYHEIRTCRPDPVAHGWRRWKDRLAGWRKTPHDGRALRTSDVRALHGDHLLKIEAMIDESFDGPTVVVTHHAPSSKSISDRYRGSAMNAAYASSLDEILLHAPDKDVKLWVHGHVHHTTRYRRGVEVVCNPVGYGVFAGKRENPGFDPKLTIEI